MAAVLLHCFKEQPAWPDSRDRCLAQTRSLSHAVKGQNDFFLQLHFYRKAGDPNWGLVPLYHMHARMSVTLT